MLGAFELVSIGDCIVCNTASDSERVLAAMLYDTQHLLWSSQSTDDLQQLSTLLSRTVAHPVVRNVLTNSTATPWSGESGIAIAYLTWIAQLFDEAWDSSFSHLVQSLAQLPESGDSLVQLRNHLQQWQRTDPLRLVREGWEPNKRILLDIVAVVAIWAMTEIGVGEIGLYSKVFDLMHFENPFIVVFTGCACLTHRKIPCTFETIDPAAYERYGRCRDLIQRFAE